MCNNGLEAATSVIMLQHKVMAADKWRHNEPWDHITIGPFRLPSMKRAVPVVRTVIYPPRKANPNNHLSLTCTARPSGMASLAHVYVFGLSTRSNLVKCGKPRRGTCKRHTKKHPGLEPFVATFLLRNNTAGFYEVTILCLVKS